MTKEELVIRASRAKGLLADPVLNETLDGLKQEAFEIFCTNYNGDKQELERAVGMTRAADAVRAKLRSMIDAGFVAEAPKPAEPV